MKIFSKTKNGNKRVIKLLGIKFSYKKKSNKKTSSQKTSPYKYSHEPILRKMFNLVYCDKMDILAKKHLIEQRFMEHGNSYFPNIDNPRSFNEKIQWMNLYYHNPLITKCTDKVTFKEYLHETLGDEYTIPTIGVYNDANEIDFDKLPDEYVLKSNWGSDSQQVFLHKKDNKKSVHEIRRIANSWLLPIANGYCYAFNWGYKDIKPKLIIEELLRPDNGELLDYKFFCFNGNPEYAFVTYDRETKLKLDFFDMNWKKLNFTRKYPNSPTPAKQPKNFQKMKEIARILSKPFPFVRVDFYEVNEKIYVGELTFTPGGGFEAFSPVEWDYKLGDLLILPNKWLDDRDF